MWVGDLEVAIVVFRFVGSVEGGEVGFGGRGDGWWWVFIGARREGRG